MQSSTYSYRKRSWRHTLRRLTFLVAILGPLVGWRSLSLARKMGTNLGNCNACHEKASNAVVKLMPSITSPGLGSTLKLSVSVEADAAKGGGVYLEARSFSQEAPLVGQWNLITGQGLRVLDGGVTHDRMPKAASNGKVTFDVDWKAPSSKSSVVFTVSGIAANLDDTHDGDAFGRASLSLAVGCNGGSDYWEDFDGDGFGSNEATPIKACDPAPGIAAKKGDCVDTDKTVLPSAKEVCNGFDDNCDGKIDEGFPAVALFRDNDNDGFGAGTETMMGCGKIFGWGVGNRDCADKDKTMFPGAMEICNGKDDDCDGRTDNGALPVCGVGLCARNAPSCETASQCKPGAPKTEKCNLLDDDCDGEVDNGDDLCSSGQQCVEGQCKAGGNSGGRGGDSGGAGGEGGEGGSNDNPDKGSGGGGCQFAAQGKPSAAVLMVLAFAGVLASRRRARERR